MIQHGNTAAGCADRVIPNMAVQGEIEWPRVPVRDARVMVELVLLEKSISLVGLPFSTPIAASVRPENVTLRLALLWRYLG